MCSVPFRLVLSPLFPLACLLLLLFPGSAAAEPAADPGAERTVQHVWDSLLQGHLQNLADISAQASELADRLPGLTVRLSDEVRNIRAEFERLSAIAQVSRNMPAELNVVAERTRRLKERLDSLAAPLQTSMDDLASRLEDLSALETDAADPASETMEVFRSELSKTRQRINRIQARLSAALSPVTRLRADIDALQKRLDEIMPSLWRNYYLSPSGKLYDPANWTAEIDRLPSVREVLSLRLTTEIPQTVRDWGLAFVRVLVILLPLTVLLRLSHRPMQRAPAPLREGWRRIERNSALWLLLGLSLHYSAWTNGNHYQILSSAGTMSLCWGQMSLAWDLSSFGKPRTSRLTPLWPMFLPLLTGMILLYFDPFPVFLGTAWLAALSLILWRAHQRAHADEKLPRFLLGGFTATAWLSLLLTLFGFARLSILICMGYTALALCVQQAVSLMHVGNVVEQYLPSEGGRGLAAGLALALALPAVLLVATLTPTLWILAYPGGAYLLQHVARMGFNIGQVSFNAVQVVSIFIAFYLTRSLISVGLTFMKGLRQQGMKLDPTLIGPFQTAYTYALWAIFVLFALSSLGFSLTSLTVVAGGLSVGVGFGMQNIVQNFISGLMVIFGQIIREGDVVEVSGTMGIVRRVNIRSTQIETYENATVFIPNSQFLSTSFTNWTHNGRMVRREVAVGVAYGSDLSLCMKLLSDVAEEQPRVLSHPAPAVFFTDFGDSSLNLLLRYWVADIDHGMSTMTDIRIRINDVFTKHGIEISFPQMDVHIRDQVTPTAPAKPLEKTPASDETPFFPNVEDSSDSPG